MKYLILLVLMTSFKLLSAPEPVLDKAEAKAAFQLLNQIRKSPQSFVEDYPFLNDIASAKELVWNEVLTRVAEEKALDMARRNYVGHVDPDGYGMNYYINKAGYSLVSPWLKDKAANYFESLNAGAPSGPAAMKTLLIDKDVPSLGHRKQLLGLDNWSASLVDIGIGFVRSNGSSDYKTYTCILVAKHRW